MEYERVTMKNGLLDCAINCGNEMSCIGCAGRMKTKRSKACDIPQAVKQKVWERDGARCIICGSPTAMPNAHYIGRAQGGLGVEQNIVTLCQTCHHTYDNSPKRPVYREYIKKYLIDKYGAGWDEEQLVYNKFAQK